MPKHKRIWFTAIIITIVILSLTFALGLSQSESTVKVKQTYVDNNFPEIREQVLNYMEVFEKKHPNVMKNFYALAYAAMDSGALDVKTKELITLGIAVSKGCDGCIAYHTHASLKDGATEEEIMEVLGVALYMGGGPSIVYATHVIEAMEQFKAIEE